LAQFFETKVGRAITERHSFKSTRPELTRDEIAKCLVGLLDEASMAKVADLARNRTIATNFSTNLTVAAKFLVEALIEGHLTESELEAAQQALENGDNGLDKAILARLTAKGIDIEDEPPLFPDLDALYQLLAEAETEAATDSDDKAESTDEQAYATP